MGPIQGMVTGALGSTAAALATGIHTSSETKIAKAAELKQKEADEEASKQASYGNELNKILGEETVNYPEFKDPDMFNKALDMMEGKKAMMLAQRQAVRAYRNQYAKDSEEYNLVESEGQARKQANFQEFRESLRQLRKGGKHNGNK